MLQLMQLIPIRSCLPRGSTGCIFSGHWACAPAFSIHESVELNHLCIDSHLPSMHSRAAEINHHAGRFLSVLSCFGITTCNDAMLCVQSCQCGSMREILCGYHRLLLLILLPIQRRLHSLYRRRRRLLQFPLRPSRTRIRQQACK
jgi:hypothetical protein